MDKIEVLPDDYEDIDFLFKIMIIGDHNTGKTSFSNKAKNNSFESAPTIGYEFSNIKIRINYDAIKLQIWDCCGQEVYRFLIKSFYKNASLAIILYPIDNKESFLHIDSWLKEVKDEVPNIKIFLVGNKSDLEESRKVSKNEGENFTKLKKLDMFFETSAKSGDNAQKVFIEAAKLLYTQKGPSSWD